MWKEVSTQQPGWLTVLLVAAILTWSAWQVASVETVYARQQAVPNIASQGSPVPVRLATDDSATPDADEIDSFVTAQMQRHGLPGLALAVVQDDQVVFMKGYGKADPSGRPITPQTPFLLASVSKPLTATAVMQMVQAGELELDAPVQRYLAEFRVADPVASSQITVRQLLLHTSGLPVTACDTRNNAATLAEFVAELQTVELSAPPGTRHSYCSGNYNVLGRILEVIAGQSFGDYMQEHVFAPLDMPHSFTSEPEAVRAGMPQGYQWFFGLPVPTHHRYNPSQLPSGYMISSVEDMSHFLIAQLNGGQYLETRLLSAETISAMQASGTERGTDGGYGLGWVISPVGEVPAVWHDGVNPGYHSMLLMQPGTQRGVVLLVNSFGVVAYESAYKEIEAGIARLLAGKDPAGPGPSLGRTYLVIDLVLAGILAIASIPLLRMRKWRGWLLARQQAGRLPLARAGLRAAAEVGGALVFLLGIRLFLGNGLGAQSWSEALAVFPDFVLWIWAFGLVLFTTGLVHMKILLQIRSAGEQNRQALLDAPFAGSR
jgi:CubicO group peptidase (beta-lactamase class C family)